MSNQVPLPSGRAPALRVVPMPSNTNQHGLIFGGWLMAQMDIACFTRAVERTKGLVATVAVNNIVFKAPIHVGDIVNIYVEIVRVGNTSLTLSLEVYSERPFDNMKTYHIASGEMVFVAIDENQRPRPIPPEA
ncbi:MAG: acyl-CoA thioesterase [Burkholderiales bacterium]|jgi:acyl-CoA thioesterase YciA|nr:acyl-CoA thioesterase [Burkholderiales bacterium]